MGKELAVLDRAAAEDTGKLRRERTPPDPVEMHYYYAIYYSSQGMFQLGQNYWKDYRPKLHGLLLQQNAPQQNGAWYGRGFDDSRYGATYCTPMAILALTVEYRLLPIYQRFEEPNERDGSDK